MRGASRRAVVVLFAVIAGALSFWGSRGDSARGYGNLKENALCVVELPAGDPSASATLKVARGIELFQVGLKSRERDGALSVLISGDKGVVGSVSFMGSSCFVLGRDIQPGSYTVTLRQEANGEGGEVAVADKESVYVTPWQIWSRSYLGLLALSGILALALRKSPSARRRTLSLAAFNSLLLGATAVFVYLLFHEGGHALAQMSFGRFDLSRSDFWGIHGHPHSGSKMGPALEPWQQMIIGSAGPMTPTFAGFALFLLWWSPFGRRMRGLGPLANVYFSAIVAVLVVAEVFVAPAYLLGMLTDEGDVIGFAVRSGGPVWLVKGLLWGVVVVSVLILWRVAPEIRRGWKARFVSGLPSGEKIGSRTLYHCRRIC